MKRFLMAALLAAVVGMIRAGADEVGITYDEATGRGSAPDVVLPLKGVETEHLVVSKGTAYGITWVPSAADQTLNWTNATVYGIALTEDNTITFEGAPSGTNESRRVELQTYGDFNIGINGVDKWRTGTNRVSGSTNGLYLFELTGGLMYGYCFSCGDVSASEVAFTPTGSIGAGNVQDAMDELQSETASALAGKQRTLTPGSNISIDPDGVISATGVGGVAGLTGSGTTTNYDDYITLYTLPLATNTGALLRADVHARGETNKASILVEAQIGNPADNTAVLEGTNVLSETHYPSNVGIYAWWDVEAHNAVLRGKGTTNENVNFVATGITANVVTNGALEIATAVPAFEEEVGRYSVATSGGTSTVTLTSDVAAGNQVVLLVAAAVEVDSVTDSAGNTYTSKHNSTGSTFYMRVLLAHVTAALEAGDTITITWTATSFGGRQIVAVETSGVSDMDVPASSEGFTASSSATVTTTAANTLILGHSIWYNSGITFTADAQTTQIGSRSEAGFIRAIYYRETESSGSYTVGGTLNTATSTSRQIVSFK